MDGKESEATRFESLLLLFHTWRRTITGDNVESRHMFTEPLAPRKAMRKNQHDHVLGALAIFNRILTERDELKPKMGRFVSRSDI